MCNFDKKREQYLNSVLFKEALAYNILSPNCIESIFNAVIKTARFILNFSRPEVINFFSLFGWIFAKSSFHYRFGSLRFAEISAQKQCLLWVNQTASFKIWILTGKCICIIFFHTSVL